MDLILRFAMGGALVCAFATISDVLKPRSFAGLFAAAPSVALASLALTVAQSGAEPAAVGAHSMLPGALALLAYANLCLYLMGRRRWHSLPVTLCSLPAWVAVTILLRALLG